MNEMDAEVARLNEHLRRMMWHGRLSVEVPLRLHEHGVDQGHGLGGPPLSAQLISFLRDAGVCFCEPIEVMEGKTAYMQMRHTCDRRFRDAPARFRAANPQSHPRRLKRALRQLRLMAPVEFDIVYLMVARGMAWQDVRERINTGRAASGQEELSVEDFMVLMIAGASKLIEAW